MVQCESLSCEEWSHQVWSAALRNSMNAPIHMCGRVCTPQCWQRGESMGRSSGHAACAVFEEHSESGTSSVIALTLCGVCDSQGYGAAVWEQV